MNENLYPFRDHRGLVCIRCREPITDPYACWIVDHRGLAVHRTCWDTQRPGYVERLVTEDRTS
jgi:hypothetical protein